MVDIKSILKEYKITFATKGPNVGRNAIAIACPYCAEIGNPDPSTHLRIKLPSNHWNCWRNKSHHGVDIYRLLSKLGIEVAIYTDNILDKICNGSFFNESEATEEVKYTSVSTEVFPNDFVPIGTKLVDKNYFRPYLLNRGFEELDQLIERYNLMRSMDLNSRWGWRVIAPVFMEHEVSWVGRSIFPTEHIKYLTPSPNEALNVKFSVFNYKELLNSKEPIDYIIVCEGYMDALKLDFYGDQRIRATCVFGVNWSDMQLKLLRNLSQRCKNIVIGYDNDAATEGFKLWQSLSDIEAMITHPPFQKDWGAMDVSEIIEFKQQFREKIETKEIKSDAVIHN